jgi:hypothetical protein
MQLLRAAVSSAAMTAVPPDDEPLLIDQLEQRLERFRILYDTDSQATDEMLGQLGGKGRVERQMLRQLAATRPLRRPERVPEAHAVAMRALEVLSRNGSRPPSRVRRLGPLTPVARYLIQQIIHYVVRRHQRSVVVALRDLYSRRVAWVPPGDPARSMLLRARLDVERATPAYEKNTVGIPAFLIGGAAVSSVTQAVRRAAGAAAGSRAGVAVAIAVTVVLLAVASWVALQAAAVARRRIKLSLDQPLAALWETIGWCGSPPKDSSRRLAVIAVALTFAGWLLIPVGLLLVVAVL